VKFTEDSKKTVTAYLDYVRRYSSTWKWRQAFSPKLRKRFKR